MGKDKLLVEHYLQRIDNKAYSFIKLANGEIYVYSYKYAIDNNFIESSKKELHGNEKQKIIDIFDKK